MIWLLIFQLLYVCAITYMKIRLLLIGGYLFFLVGGGFERKALIPLRMRVTPRLLLTGIANRFSFVSEYD